MCTGPHAAHKNSIPGQRKLPRHGIQEKVQPLNCHTPKLPPSLRDTRTERISGALAVCCGVVQRMLDTTQPDHGSTQALRSRTVVVPGIPTSIPSTGLCILEEWARMVAAHGPHTAWLAPFLHQHRLQLDEAMIAADYLDCRGFLELGADALLLFLVNAGNYLVGQVAEGQRPSKQRQLWVDFARLPYVASVPSAASSSNDGSSSGHSGGAMERGPGHFSSLFHASLRRACPHMSDHIITQASSACDTALGVLAGGIQASGMLPRTLHRADIRECLLRVGFLDRLVAWCHVGLKGCFEPLLFVWPIYAYIPVVAPRDMLTGCAKGNLLCMPWEWSSRKNRNAALRHPFEAAAPQRDRRTPQAVTQALSERLTERQLQRALHRWRRSDMRGVVREPVYSSQKTGRSAGAHVVKVVNARHR